MRLFMASSSASVVFFAFLFNLYLGKIDFPWFPGIGMAQLGLWLTPLVVALASVVTLFRLKDGGTGADGDRKQFTVLRGKGRPRVLESASTTWGGLGRSLRTLAPYLWPQESATMQLIILGCFSILAMKRFLNFYVVIVEKQIVDALRKETDFCWELILTFLTLKFGQRVFGSLFFTTWSKVSQYTDREVKLRLFSHLHELSLRWHLERKTGAVMRIMNRGASSLGSLLWFLVFKLIPVTADLIIAVTFLVTTFNFWFGALVFATLGLYLAMLSWSRWYSKHTKSTNMAVNDQESKSLDSILNYATVKHFGAEQYEIERYAGTSSLTMSEQFKLLVLTELLGTIDEFGLHCCLLVGYLYCAHLVADPNTSLTVSDYLLFGRYFNQLTNPLRNLVHVWMNSVQKNVVDMEDMFQLLNEEPEVKDKPGAPPLVFTEGKIEFRDVNFSYNPERAILKNVSFTVNPGETVAFVGPTGAGKSTVVQLLFRFFDVQEGRITIDSQNIRDVTQSSLRRNIGVVPQDTVLFNDTIRYNIRYGKPDATDKEVETAAVNAGLHEKILAFPKGYDTMVGERGLRLSGGEKQRVAIARQTSFF